MVYVDENGNGRLDKNFIGIPREPLGFSNRYWPRGPPTFRRAAFRLDAGETRAFDIELRPVFGERGLLGAGVGVIAQTSPYRGSGHTIVQPIPAISYVGDRLQILGPSARFGLLNLGDVRLAATASYRVGAYAEDDSDALHGLGDRDDTVMGGVAVQAELPAGVVLAAGYEHDVLDRAEGGQGRIKLSKAFQRGMVTASPQLAVDWLTEGLAQYEFGVPPDQARDDRPAYQPGDAIVPELGVNLFLELSGSWRIVLNGSVAFLPSELTASPIVDHSQVFKGFAAVIRMF
jgi:outer membrane protein